MCGVFVVHLRQQDAQQQSCHDLIVVHQPEEGGVGAASDVDLINQLQTLHRVTSCFSAFVLFCFLLKVVVRSK